MADTFGAALRSWRQARRVSQEQLADRAGISARHLSFVETGRSQPSREVVLALAGALEVPLRERNLLLTAAGFAAAYQASPLDGAELTHMRRALDHILAQQEPYGAAVLDSRWNLVRLNRGAQRLLACFPPASADGLAAARNLLLGLVHADAFAPYIVNWDEVASSVVMRLHHEIAGRPGDDELPRLLARVLAQPRVPAAWRSPTPGRTAAPFVTIHLRGPALEVHLFTMLASIGTPLDVTAEELHVELYFPADDASDAALRALAD